MKLRQDLKTQRAAELDDCCNLLESAKGVSITNETKVKDFITAEDKTVCSFQKLRSDRKKGGGKREKYRVQIGKNLELLTLLLCLRGAQTCPKTLLVLLY